MLPIAQLIAMRLQARDTAFLMALLLTVDSPRSASGGAADAMLADMLARRRRHFTPSAYPPVQRSTLLMPLISLPASQRLNVFFIR